MKGRPSQKLVASINVHQPRRMRWPQRWLVSWWLIKQAVWLMWQKAESMPASRFTAKMTRVVNWRTGVLTGDFTPSEPVPPIVKACEDRP